MPSTSVEWDNDLQTLYIKMNSAMTKGLVEFELQSIRNPFSTSKLTGFQISTLTSDKLGLIESTIG